MVLSSTRLAARPVKETLRQNHLQLPQLLALWHGPASSLLESLLQFKQNTTLCLVLFAFTPVLSHSLLSLLQFPFGVSTGFLFDCLVLIISCFISNIWNMLKFECIMPGGKAILAHFKVPRHLFFKFFVQGNQGDC